MTSTLTDFQTTGSRNVHSERLFETKIQRHRRQRTEWEKKDRAKKRCMRDIFAKSNEELLKTNETYKIEINRLRKDKDRLKGILQQHDCRLRVLPPITPTTFSPCSTDDITKMTSEGTITDSQGDWCKSSQHIESFEWKSKTKAEEKITENETSNVAGDMIDDVMKGDGAAGTYFLSDGVGAFKQNAGIASWWRQLNQNGNLPSKAGTEQREKTFIQRKLNRKGDLPFKARTEQREEAPFQLRSSSSFSAYSSANTLVTSSAFDASSKATASTSENFVEKQNSYGWSSCQNVSEASTVGSVNSLKNRNFAGSNVYQALQDTVKVTSVTDSANRTSDGFSSCQTLFEATVVTSVSGIDQTHISDSFNLRQAAAEGTTVTPANGFGNRTSARADPAHISVAFGELPADVSVMMSLYGVCIDDDFLMDCWSSQQL